MIRKIIVAGGILLGSTKYHLREPKTYLVSGAIGLGAGLALKSVGKGVGLGATAAWGIIGYTGMTVLDEMDKRANNVED